MYITTTSKTAGAAAEVAEEKKRVKYASLSDNYIFSPLGFETLGSWGADAVSLVSRIGKLLVERTGESRSPDFLRQRISIEIQRHNALCIFGTIPPSRGLDEIFYLVRDH